MKKKMKFALFAIALIALPLLAGGCSQRNAQGQAKYVFFFIGDGMGPSQVAAAEYYLATKDDVMNFDITRLNFTRFPAAALVNTHDFGSLITDSASAATAFATGRKTFSNMINVDPVERTPNKTIAEYAQEAGRKIGIVSSVTLTHATPASFYAKTASRWNRFGSEDEPAGLARQLVESGFDYFAGGWIVWEDEQNDNYLDQAREAGYTVTRTRADFNALERGGGKVIALAERVQDSGSMHYEIDRRPEDLSLADFTRKGIELLENPGGFFIMVEGGKIDWAGHANDAGALIHDILALDDAVGVALEFYRRYPDETLIVVIGDHETGGMALGWAGTPAIPDQRGVSQSLGTGYSMYFDRIARQTRSFIAFNEEVVNPYKARVVDVSQRRLSDLYADIYESFGVDLRPDSLNISEYQRNQIDIAFRRSMGQPAEAPQEGWRVFSAGYESLTLKLTHVMNQQAGIGWTSYSHTATPVAAFALGAGWELFGGYYDNTDVFFRLAGAMGLNVE